MQQERLKIMNFFEKKEKQVELQKKMYVADTKLNLFLLILFPSHTDVNWLPVSSRPYGYSRQSVLIFLSLVFLLL